MAVVGLGRAIIAPSSHIMPIADISSRPHHPRMTEISKRLLDQRLRNRVMEEVFGLADWQDSLKSAGFVEYFETFFDQYPYEGEPYLNEVMTDEELTAIREVRSLMIKASDDTPKMMSEDDFIATGWPQRIEPAAERTLRLMLDRGRYSEEHEESVPSTDDGWPWCDRFGRGE